MKRLISLCTLALAASLCIPAAYGQREDRRAEAADAVRMAGPDPIITSVGKAPALNIADGGPGQRRAFTAEGVTNAASFDAGAVAPGELITIFGTGLGPAELAPLEVSGGIVVSQLANTRVLFDGVAGALVYVWSTQVSVAVPFSVHGKQTTEVQVERDGTLSDPVTVEVADAAPGCFSLDSTGEGQAAIINQDGTVNSPENPAPQGSIVAIYCTGAGQTDPAGIDGKVASTEYPKPLLDVEGQIGFLNTREYYAGAAPWMMAGMIQVNMEVPAELNGGPNVPVRIKVGDFESQADLTMAVTQLSGGALAPGMTIELAGTSHSQNPDLGGGGPDLLREFRVTNSQGSPILSGMLTDRIVTSTNTGKVIAGPRTYDLDNHGTGAGLARLDVSGFAGVAVNDANYRFDSTGDRGPVRAMRSEDGDTISFFYEPPLTPPESSYFLTVMTDSTTFDETGRITLYAQVPGDETLYTGVIENTQAPQ